MSRVDEREIPGASDSIDLAPDLLKLRKSNRARVPKRQWEQVEASKPRKKPRLTPLPTPNSTQQTTQPATQGFTIFEDKPEANNPSSDDNEPSRTASREKKQKKAAWQVKYSRLKKQSKGHARDYLVEIIGHDDYPEALQIPQLEPKVLLDGSFKSEDPLSIWRQFIAEEDLHYITSKTNENAQITMTKYRQQRPVGTQRRARRWKTLTTVEIGAYFGALYLLGTQGAASLVDNWSTSEDSPVYPIRKFISLNRFQQISRYIKLNTPGKDNDNLKDKDFWHKVDPLVTSFRQRCRANLQPGNVFSIDEQQTKQRSLETRFTDLV
jgi:Transposase IS4